MKHNDPAGIGNAMSFGSTPLSAKNVKTNIARSFLHLVDTHFPAGHKLHKIFNRNNVRSIITNHNTWIIRKSQTQVTSADNCNCRNKEACPLQNKCMNKYIVYKATISTSNANDTKHYIGMTSSTFKERYRNHQIFYTPEIFKRNGTFETRLAPKAKENRFHHKMVNNKKIYFLHGRI